MHASVDAPCFVHVYETMHTQHMDACIGSALCDWCIDEQHTNPQVMSLSILTSSIVEDMWCKSIPPIRMCMLDVSTYVDVLCQDKPGTNASAVSRTNRLDVHA